MDVWRITLAALRRWYVLLPLLALTGVIAVTMGNRVAPEYEGRAAGMLTPARAETEVANPYGSVTGANEALGIVLNSNEVRGAVAEQGLPAGYEVGAAARSTILQLTTRAATPEEATATAQAVLDLAVQELSARQTEAGLPPQGQITLSVLESPSVTSVVDTGAVRAQAVVVVLGGALSLLVAVLFDDIVGLWRRARGKGPRQKRARNEASAGRDADDAAPSDAVDVAPATADDAPAKEPSPRRKTAPAARRDARGSAGGGNGTHAGMDTAAPSINSALINTNEWVWPGDHSLEEALDAEQQPPSRRNPFFDPEFTKRQLAKTKRAPADDEADATSAARRP